MTYRYFYDCEFVEDGRLIDLVSIGVVDEHGREFYAVSTEFDGSRALPWVRKHVLEKLPSPAAAAWRSRERIRDDLYAFLVEPLNGHDGTRGATELELWAWYAAYDHVALAQLWGPMPALPREIPRFTKDLRQLWDELGQPRLPGADADRHDALVDARHNLARWRAMAALRR
jgi:3' exoribonuclease, RNase T-like